MSVRFRRKHNDYLAAPAAGCVCEYDEYRRQCVLLQVKNMKEKGCSHQHSSFFLRESLARLNQAGWRVVNIDVIIFAQDPKLGPVKAAIRRRLAAVVGELQRAGEYQYQVINDDLDTAVAELRAILQRHFTRG